MLPGVGKIKQQLEGAKLDTAILARQAAIICSMTPRERRTPDILKASRKKRIAAGSGTSVQDVNKLLKQFDDMSAMMKRMNKMGQKGLMRGGLAALLPGMAEQTTLLEIRRKEASWASRSASPAPVRRSAPTTTSWWPTAVRPRDGRFIEQLGLLQPDAAGRARRPHPPEG